MKNLIKLSFRLLFPLVAMLAIGSCQSAELDIQGPEAEGQQKELREVIITASISDAKDETRTSYNETEGKNYWSPGDKIKVFSAGEEAEFTSMNTSPEPIVKFKGYIASITGSSNDDDDSKDYVWGLYPYSTGATYAEPDGISRTAQITMTYPDVQVGVAGTFGDNLAVMIGRSESLSIPFRGAYSGAFFKVSRSDIVSMTLRGLNNEVLVGKATIGLDNNLLPVVEEVTDGKTAVTVTAPNGTFEPDKNYYIITLPDVALPNGYSVTLRRSDGYEGTYELRANRPLNRIRFRNLSEPVDVRIENPGNISDGVSTGWVRSATQGINEIWYVTSDNSVAEYGTMNTGVAVNEVDTDNCVAPSDNGGVGILRFKGPVTKIDDYAFENNRKLTSVYWPETVETIGQGAFAQCMALSEIEIGPNVRVIEEDAFWDTEISSLSLPEGIRRIDNCAFQNIPITEVTIPNSVDSLGYSMPLSGTRPVIGNPFMDCAFLTTFHGRYASSDGKCLIDNGTVRSFATGGMTGASYEVPSDVTVIGIFSFVGATISHITLPSRLQAILDYSFMSCKITELTIPASVSMINQYAFMNCSRLNWIKIMRSSTVIEASSTWANPGNMFRTNNCPIYVPANLINYYKNEQYWESYKDRYQPLVEPNQIFYTTSDGEAVSYAVDSSTGNSLLASGCKAPNDNGGIGVIQFTAPITKVDAEALAGDERLVSVTLPDTVEEIGEAAFSECENLTDVLLSANLKRIYPEAFAYTAISSIDLPEGLESIDYMSFEGCANLQEVRIPDSVRYLGFYGNTFNGNPFFMCRNLTSFSGKFASDDGKCLVFTNGALVSFAPSGMDGQTYTLPSEVTRISAYSMAYSTLKEAILPSGVTRINKGAFYVSSIETVTIPESVQLIDEIAFANCGHLSKIRMEGATPPTLGNSALANTPADMVIEIPGAGYTAYTTAEGWADYASQMVIYQTNKEIWYSMVDGDTSTPASFTPYTDISLIGNNAFPYTSGTTKIIPMVDIPESIEETNIFVASFDDNVTTIPKLVFSSNAIKTKVEYVSMPNTVTTVGSYAFDGCSNLLRWPFRQPASGGPSITSVGAWAFHSCSSMVGDKISWINYDSAIYLGYYDVQVGNYAFQDCDKIEAFAGNVNSLGEFAFHGCNELASVQVGNITTIPRYAFSGCTSLKTLLYNGTVTSIGDRAFQNCGLLANVNVANMLYFPNVTSIGQYAFNACKVIQSAMFGAVTSIGAHAFDACWKLQSVELADPSALTTLGQCAFLNTLELKSIGSSADITNEVINLPNLTSLGLSCFSSAKIKHVTLPRLQIVSQQSFAHCGQLEYLELPSVTEIQLEAFSHTRGLTTLKLGAGLTTIGAAIFTDTSSTLRNYDKLDVYFYGPIPTSVNTYAFMYGQSATADTFRFKKIHTTYADHQDYENQWQDTYGPIVADL